jgi:flavin reductase (DIM6/NTAB) family NADH-FMN oxidoreductase RutF
MSSAAPPTSDTASLAVPAAFREAMRRVASSVMIITCRDGEGEPHGMAVSSAISVSMEPPSMLIAINRNASLYSVLQRTGRFCANLLSEHQENLLLPFSQTALRAQRFTSADWCDVRVVEHVRLPWLPDALASIDCSVDIAHDYGSHTLFIARVVEVHCRTLASTQCPPLVWLTGQPAALIKAS